MDENGEPLVVYHGTNSEFWKFDSERVGENYGIDSEGFFFTDDRFNADNYADDKVGVTGEGSPRTVPALSTCRFKSNGTALRHTKGAILFGGTALEVATGYAGRNGFQTGGLQGGASRGAPEFPRGNRRP